MHRTVFGVAILGALVCTRVHAQEPQVNALGRRFPGDAAPLDQQRIRSFEIDGPYMEWFKAIYKRSSALSVLTPHPISFNTSSVVVNSTPASRISNTLFSVVSGATPRIASSTTHTRAPAFASPSAAARTQ